MNPTVFDEVFRATLDKAQAYEVTYPDIPGDKLIELQKMLYALNDAHIHYDTVDVLRSVAEINKWLEHEWSCLPSDMHRTAIRFIERRQQKQDINEVLKSFINEEKSRFETVCSAIENNLDTSAPETPHNKQYTVDGKLMKERVCTVCGSKFSAHRQDATYCSAKCRKAAGRAKKEKI